MVGEEGGCIDVARCWPRLIRLKNVVVKKITRKEWKLSLEES